MNNILEVIHASKLNDIIGLIFSLFVIYIFFKITGRLIKKITAKKCSLQTQHIIKNIIRYSSFTVMILTVFHRFGINISAILGAAGIAGVAIGFAAQTSVSNIISGLFVITERAFKIGDTIEISGTMGTVQTINLLSVTLKTFDNQYVRIPNETIIKANLVNYSHFPIRRVTTDLAVAYGSDLKKVEAVLLDTAKKNPYAAEDPAPSIAWTGFADSAITLTLRTWTTLENFMLLRNSIFVEAYNRLAEEDISIPFPQMDVYIKQSGNVLSDNPLQAQS
ncbi:MAG: mechanosensitive ion channel family protein [Treponema sp.]